MSDRKLSSQTSPVKAQRQAWGHAFRWAIPPQWLADRHPIRISTLPTFRCSWALPGWRACGLGAWKSTPSVFHAWRRPKRSLALSYNW